VRRFPGIGPNWVDAKGDSGRRRFENPDDFVTTEIAAALARNIRVIPVLVDGARTAKADKLPDSIKPLVRRNAVEVRNTNFGRDDPAPPSQEPGEFSTSGTSRDWAGGGQKEARLFCAFPGCASGEARGREGLGPELRQIGPGNPSAPFGKQGKTESRDVHQSRRH
jgi:hypothetical protein